MWKIKTLSADNLPAHSQETQRSWQALRSKITLLQLHSPGFLSEQPELLLSTRPVLELRPNASQVGPGSKLIPDGLTV